MEFLIGLRINVLRSIASRRRNGRCFNLRCWFQKLIWFSILNSGKRTVFIKVDDCLVTENLNEATLPKLESF